MKAKAAGAILWGILMGVVVTWAAAQESVLKHRPVGPSLSQAEYESPYAIYMHPGEHGMIPWYDATSGTLKGLAIGPDGTLLRAEGGRPRWVVDAPPYEYTLVESDAERPPIHHYRLNDAVTRTTDTLTVKDEGIGAPGVGTRDLTASVVANTWTTTGKVNEAFDGVNYYAHTVSSSAPPTGPLTISAWFRVPDEAAFQALSIYQYNNVVFGNTHIGTLSGSYFSVYRSGSDLRVVSDVYSSYYTIPAEKKYSWNHVAYVYENLSDSAPCKQYVNGTLRNTSTKSKRTENAHINIASRWDDPKLSAVVDDARIYDYALSPEQIERLYNSGLGTEQSITTGTQVLRDSIIYDSGGRTYIGTAMPGGAGEIQFATSATTRAVLDNDALTVSVPIVGDLTGDVTGNLTGHADTATTATVALTSADYTTPTLEQTIAAGNNTSTTAVNWATTATVAQEAPPLADVLASGNNAGGANIAGVSSFIGSSLSALSASVSDAYVTGRLRVGTVSPDSNPAIDIQHVNADDGRAILAREGDIEVTSGGLTVSDGIEATTATIGAVSATTATLSAGTIATTPTLDADIVNKAYVDANAGDEYTTPSLSTVLDAGSDAGGRNITGVGNLTTTGTVSAQTVTAAGTVSGTTGNLTTVNATIVNAGSGGVLSEGDISSDAGLVAGTDATVGRHLTVTSDTTVGRTLYLPGQAKGSLDGAIYRDGIPFIHTYIDSTAIAENSYNLFIGQDAGGSFSSGQGATASYHGTNNTGIGYQALRDVTTGFNNFGMGGSALRQNASGAHNVAIGFGAMRNNVSGIVNLGIGTDALRNNINGNRNSAMGVYSLYNLSSGSRNTAIGYDSGRFVDGGSNNTTASNSIYIGAETRSAYDGVTNQIVIGYEAIGLGDNTVVLGNDSITTTVLRGYVGIGTTAPTEALDVVGNVYVSGSVSADSYIDHTPGWSLSSADALDAVTGVRYTEVVAEKDTTTRYEIDHSTIPEFARTVSGIERVPTGKTITRTREVEVVRDADDGTTYTETVVFEDQIPETVDVEIPGRDLGAMITLLTESVKELEARNAALEARILALEPDPIGEVRE